MPTLRLRDTSENCSTRPLQIISDKIRKPGIELVLAVIEVCAIWRKHVPFGINAKRLREAVANRPRLRQFEVWPACDGVEIAIPLSYPLTEIQSITPHPWIQANPGKRLTLGHSPVSGGYFHLK